MSLLSRGEGRLPMPIIQSEISILNAEQYGEEPAYQPVAVPATASRNVGSKGKRSVPSDRAEGGGDGEEEEVKKKRTRGRPRLDTKDESAAERRRTQIRLAQRAYRHRKDTTITTLEQKVKELETANETMGKEFSKFYDIILTEGILDMAPHAAPRLRRIADKLFRLASAAGGGNATASSESEEPTVPESSDRRGTLNSSSEVGTQMSSVNHGSQTSVVADPEANTSSSGYSSSLPGVQQQANMISYEIVTQATPNNASFPFYASMEPIQSQNQFSYLGHPIPNFSPYAGLPSPMSYAFQERTFSRRLQRRTLERGLKLASMPNPPPIRYAEVFGFCLLFESRESIIRRLRAGLKRSSNENLDTWKVPITALPNDQFSDLETNFGSAGSDISNQALLPMGKSAGIAGFPTMPTFGPHAQSALDEKLEQRIRLICQNFESEFFTSDEVELFLCRLGINIPQHADYVEAEVDLNDLGGSEETGLSTPSQVGGGVGMTTPSSGFGGVTPQFNAMGMWSLGATPLGGTPLGGHGMNLGFMFGETPDLNSGLGGYMNAQDMGQMWSTPANWTKTKVTVDVCRLIEEMVGSAVCLGRTPGVRPKDVVKAVKVAAGLMPVGA